MSIDDAMLSIDRARYDCEIQADARLRLNRAIVAMERFLHREEFRQLGLDDPTRLLGQRLAEEGRRLVRGALNVDDTPHEATLRSAYRLTSSLANLAAWTAPASQESHALNSFPAVAARDVVAYARYGCAETSAQELAYALMLGFDRTEARLLLTSSGMAAYALIEHFLLRDVIQPGDRVVLHPGVYFETQQQLKELPFLQLHFAAGGSRAAMIRSIAATQPKVVFVDPLSNSRDFRAIDMQRLLDEAAQVCERETWFVVDGTLLSGGFNAFTGPVRPRIRVLYYESGCKYLQFGMDLGPAGIVVVEASLAERFLALRRGSGAIAAETLVVPQASRAAYLDYLRDQTACALGVARTVNAITAGDGRTIRAIHPLLPEHPDREDVQRYEHGGGLLAFRFATDALNKRKPLESFIDILLARARLQALPLTAGVSFGFRVARIGAAWSSYNADDAFLRLSAGIDLERAPELGRLIGESARDFVYGELATA